MPDDDWERHEHRLFGRTPTTDDLLDRHLNRTGAYKFAQDDAGANVQVALLRDFLAVLRAALDDEHVDPDVCRRVIERVIYGGVPSPAEVEQRLTVTKAFTDYMRTDTRPFRINVDAETLKRLRRRDNPTGNQGANPS